MGLRSIFALAVIVLSAESGTLHAQQVESSPVRCGEDYLSLARNVGYEVRFEALATDPEITKGQNREVRIYFEFDKSDNTFGFIAKGPKQQCNLIEGSNWKWSAALPGIASEIPTTPPKSLDSLRDDFDGLGARLSRQYGETIVGTGERGAGGEKANRVIFFANPITATWTIAEVHPVSNLASVVAFGTLYSKR
jgi:hypothetical protein